MKARWLLIAAPALALCLVSCDQMKKSDNNDKNTQMNSNSAMQDRMQDMRDDMQDDMNQMRNSRQNGTNRNNLNQGNGQRQPMR